MLFENGVSYQSAPKNTEVPSIRLCALLWPFPFLVRLGWATARTPNPDPAGARGRVFLLRGNGIVFSRGFGVLCDQLRRTGFWAEDLRCVGDRWAVGRLLADHRAGRLHGPVVFIGHSCGGRYSLHAAQRLEKAGIEVELIVCLDVAIPFDVPGNVRRAFHLYLSGPRLYPARPLRLAAGAAGAIDNLDLKAIGSPIDARGLCHLNFTDRPAVREFVLQQVFAACPSRHVVAIA